MYYLRLSAFWPSAAELAKRKAPRFVAAADDIPLLTNRFYVVF